MHLPRLLFLAALSGCLATPVSHRSSALAGSHDSTDKSVGFFSESSCSGTLIGSRTVLTAAHCHVEAGDDFMLAETKNTKVEKSFLQNDSSTVTNVALGEDLAIAKLAEPVIGVVPMRLAET